MKKVSKQGVFYELKKNKMLYAMFLPAITFYVMFAYIPMPGVIVAFKDFKFNKGIFGSNWNGFENFRYFFESGQLKSVTLNTVSYNLLFLASSLLLSILAGILIAEMTGRYFKKVAQTFMFLPYFISWVTVAAFVYNFMGYEYGVVNTALRSIGMEGIDIYSNPGVWGFIFPFLYNWKGIGYTSVMILAAIMGIDQECYESATIDGARQMQKIWYITLPLLKPIVVILSLLGVSRVMRGEFDMFYQMIGTNGLLYKQTDIIDTLVFRSLAGNSDFGMASAAGLYQSVLCFVIIISVNWIVKKVNSDYALF